jgi:hypothetical protein
MRKLALLLFVVALLAAPVAGWTWDDGANPAATSADSH